jgi:hypothetical protein
MLIAYLPRGELITYNLIIVLSIALSGFFMFMLGEKLFKNRLAAAGAALIYMFSPYAMARAEYHLTLVEVFVFPLILYVALNLKEDFSRRNKILFFLTLLLVLDIHPYYSFMVLLMLGLLAAYFLVRTGRRGRQALRENYSFIRQGFLITLAASIIAGLLTLVPMSLSAGGVAAFTRPEGDLYTYAAHGWNYYMPSVHSIFFGSAAQTFISSRLTSTNLEEYVLFLGFINVALAMGGFVFWLSRRFGRFADRITKGLQEKAPWLIPFAVWLGLISFLFSLQPTIKIGGLTLYMPSWFVYKLIPFIRVYARFGIMVFFSITLISGACIAFLSAIPMAKWKLVGRGFIVLVLVLSLVELADFEKKPVQDLYKAKAFYEEIANLPPDSVIVDYPFVACDESFNSVFLWNSLFYGKPMLNGYPLGSQGEAMRIGVLNLNDPRTPPLLAYMGADYVMVNKEMFEKGSDYSYQAQDVDLDHLPQGLEMISDDSEGALIKITAIRPEAVVLYDTKCSLAGMPGIGTGLWLQLGNSWTMKIDATRDMTADIEFTICSVQGNRDLKIDDDGPIDQVIPDAPQRVSLKGVALRSGMNEIRLSTQTKQVAYNAVFGGNDSKGVSFAMSFWNIVPIAARNETSSR